MRFDTPDGQIDVGIDTLIVVGWTGRDVAAVEHHIAELAEIGVPAPSTVPLYYRVSHSLLTQDAVLQVLGEVTSGEVEPFLLRHGEKLWLGIASDHTDRELEAVSVASSKQVCGKPLGRALWSFDEVVGHLDQLELTCDIEEDGAWISYQAGTLADIRPLPELIEGSGLPEGGGMLCGTLAAKGGVRPAKAYRMVLTDPVLGRSLALDYTVSTLPVIS